MRKALGLFLAAALLVVFAAPAMADFNFSGFIRTKGVVSNYERYDAGTFIPFDSLPAQGDVAANFSVPALETKRLLIINTDKTSHYVEERGRLKFEAKTENVGAVAFFEIDMRWGDQQYTVARNQGGGLEADSINLETKNLYVWFKPNADTTINVGMQNITDAYRGIIFGAADMAGVFITGKFEPVDYRIGWAKLGAGSNSFPNGTGTTTVTTGVGATVPADKDVDFYAAEVHMSPVKEARLGLNFYFIRDKQNTTIGGVTFTPPFNVFNVAAEPGLESIKSYYIGADGSIKLDPVTLSAFALYNWGKIDFAPTSAFSDTDINAYAADVRADAAIGPGKAFIEALYVSGTKPGDDKWKTLVTGSTWALAASFYASTDMEILLPNLDDINTSQALAYEVSNLGGGMIHVGAGFTMPLMDKLTGKVGVGYLRAAEKFAFAKESQATEVNAKLNYNLAKGLDLTGVAAYAFLGDAYDGLDAKDPYKLVARLNYAF